MDKIQGDPIQLFPFLIDNTHKKKQLGKNGMGLPLKLKSDSFSMQACSLGGQERRARNVCPPSCTISGHMSFNMGWGPCKVRAEKPPPSSKAPCLYVEATRASTPHPVPKGLIIIGPQLSTILLLHSRE